MSRTAIRRRVDLSDGRLVIRTTIVETADIERFEDRAANSAATAPPVEAAQTQERRPRFRGRKASSAAADRG